MTRTFRETIRCVRCGLEFTAETDFERWMRGHRDLKSHDGIVRFDLDLLLHRYKHEIDGLGDRQVQCIMFVEIKTYMAKPTLAQRDTLGVLDQLLRNRKRNVNSTPRRQCDESPGNRVESRVLGKEVTIFAWGGHLLQLSGRCPETSDQMLWDGKHKIDREQLVKLLRFELNPDRPGSKTDLRRRYMRFANRPFLPGFALGEGGDFSALP